MRRRRCKARVDPQLRAGVPTAGEDCGVRTVKRCIAWSSCGRVQVPVRIIRQRMGKPTGPTNPPDWLRVLHHPDTQRQFRQAGLQPPKATLRGVSKLGLIVGAPVKSAINALGNGRMLCVAESYVPWHGTRWQGSFTFGTSYRDDHAVSYVGIEGDVGMRTTTRYDSLADGRGPGIVTGPSVVPWKIVADAMGELELSPSNATRDPLGRGKWAGMVVARALPLDDDNGGPVDPPPPPDTCEAKLARLQAEYDALQADYDALSDAADDVRMKLAELASELDMGEAPASSSYQTRAAISVLAHAVGEDDELPADVPVVPGVAVARDPDPQAVEDVDEEVE